jgi:hypothetical protein
MKNQIHRSPDTVADSGGADSLRRHPTNPLSNKHAGN